MEYSENPPHQTLEFNDKEIPTSVQDSIKSPKYHFTTSSKDEFEKLNLYTTAEEYKKVKVNSHSTKRRKREADSILLTKMHHPEQDVRHNVDVYAPEVSADEEEIESHSMDAFQNSASVKTFEQESQINSQSKQSSTFRVINDQSEHLDKIHPDKVTDYLHDSSKNTDSINAGKSLTPHFHTTNRNSLGFDEKQQTTTTSPRFVRGPSAEFLERLKKLRESHTKEDPGKQDSQMVTTVKPSFGGWWKSPFKSQIKSVKTENQSSKRVSNMNPVTTSRTRTLRPFTVFTLNRQSQSSNLNNHENNSSLSKISIFNRGNFHSTNSRSSPLSSISNKFPATKSVTRPSNPSNSFNTFKHKPQPWRHSSSHQPQQNSNFNKFPNQASRFFSSENRQHHGTKQQIFGVKESGAQQTTNAWPPALPSHHSNTVNENKAKKDPSFRQSTFNRQRNNLFPNTIIKGNSFQFGINNRLKDKNISIQRLKEQKVSDDNTQSSYSKVQLLNPIATKIESPHSSYSHVPSVSQLESPNSQGRPEILKPLIDLIPEGSPFLKPLPLEPHRTITENAYPPLGNLFISSENDVNLDNKRSHISEITADQAIDLWIKQEKGSNSAEIAHDLLHLNQNSLPQSHTQFSVSQQQVVTPQSKVSGISQETSSLSFLDMNNANHGNSELTQNPNIKSDLKFPRTDSQLKSSNLRNPGDLNNVHPTYNFPTKPLVPLDSHSSHPFTQNSVFEKFKNSVNSLLDNQEKEISQNEENNNLQFRDMKHVDFHQNFKPFNVSSSHASVPSISSGFINPTANTVPFDNIHSNPASLRTSSHHIPGSHLAKTSSPSSFNPSSFTKQTISFHNSPRPHINNLGINNASPTIPPPWSTPYRQNRNSYFNEPSIHDRIPQPVKFNMSDLSPFDRFIIDPLKYAGTETPDGALNGDHPILINSEILEQGGPPLSTRYAELMDKPALTFETVDGSAFDKAHKISLEKVKLAEDIQSLLTASDSNEAIEGRSTLSDLTDENGNYILEKPDTYVSKYHNHHPFFNKNEPVRVDTSFNNFYKHSAFRKIYDIVNPYRHGTYLGYLKYANYNPMLKVDHSRSFSNKYNPEISVHQPSKKELSASAISSMLENQVNDTHGLTISLGQGRDGLIDIENKKVRQILIKDKSPFRYENVHAIVNPKTNVVVSIPKNSRILKAFEKFRNNVENRKKSLNGETNSRSVNQESEFDKKSQNNTKVEHSATEVGFDKSFRKVVPNPIKYKLDLTPEEEKDMSVLTLDVMTKLFNDTMKAENVTIEELLEFFEANDDSDDNESLQSEFYGLLDEDYVNPFPEDLPNESPLGQQILTDFKVDHSHKVSSHPLPHELKSNQGRNLGGRNLIENNDYSSGQYNISMIPKNKNNQADNNVEEDHLPIPMDMRHSEKPIQDPSPVLMDINESDDEREDGKFEMEQEEELRNGSAGYEVEKYKSETPQDFEMYEYTDYYEYDDSGIEYISQQPIKFTNESDNAAIIDEKEEEEDALIGNSQSLKELSIYDSIPKNFQVEMYDSNTKTNYSDVASPHHIQFEEQSYKHEEFYDDAQNSQIESKEIERDNLFQSQQLEGHEDDQKNVEVKNDSKLSSNSSFPPDFLEVVASLEESRAKKRHASNFTLSKLLNLPHKRAEKEDQKSDGDGSSEYRARILLNQPHSGQFTDSLFRETVIASTNHKGKSNYPFTGDNARDIEDSSLGFDQYNKFNLNEANIYSGPLEKATSNSQFQNPQLVAKDSNSDYVLGIFGYPSLSGSQSLNSPYVGYSNSYQTPAIPLQIHGIENINVRRYPYSNPHIPGAQFHAHIPEYQPTTEPNSLASYYSDQVYHGTENLPEYYNPGQGLHFNSHQRYARTIDSPRSAIYAERSFQDQYSLKPSYRMISPLSLSAFVRNDVEVIQKSKSKAVKLSPQKSVSSRRQQKSQMLSRNENKYLRYTRMNPERSARRKSVYREQVRRITKVEPSKGYNQEGYRSTKSSSNGGFRKPTQRSSDGIDRLVIGERQFSNGHSRFNSKSNKNVREGTAKPDYISSNNFRSRKNPALSFRVSNQNAGNKFGNTLEEHEKTLPPYFKD